MALHLKATGIDFADFGNTTATGTSVTSELLGDYEFGTFEPSYGGNSGLNRVFNKFVKIGNWGFLQSYVGIGSGGNENLLCQLLPFTCPANGYATGMMNNQGGYGEHILMRTVVNNSTLSCYGPNQASININQVDGSHLIWSLHYCLV